MCTQTGIFAPPSTVTISSTSVNGVAATSGTISNNAPAATSASPIVPPAGTTNTSPISPPAGVTNTGTVNGGIAATTVPSGPTMSPQGSPPISTSPIGVLAATTRMDSPTLTSIL